MNDAERDPLEALVASGPLWKLEAYRLSVQALRLSWSDVSVITRDSRCRSIADQLHRATGSVGANIVEGLSRGGGRDRARFLEYALGSAREARHWHLAVSRVLGTGTCEERVERLNCIARLLLVMIRTERSRRRLGD